MKLSMVSIHDKLVGYGKAFCETNNSVAVRTFASTINHMIEHSEEYNTSPHDLSIYQVGNFDTETGLLESFDSPMFLTSGTLIINAPDIRDVKDDSLRSKYLKEYNEVMNNEE